MENEVVVTQFTEVWLGEDGIVRSVELPNTGVKVRAATLAHTKEVFSAILKASKGKKRPFLSDVRKFKSADRESREYFASKEVANAISAMAVLIGSPVGRIMGNFFLNFNKPKYPVKLFTSESAAIEWLKGFIE